MRLAAFVLAFVLPSMASPAFAQSPPIKPGLWQVKSVREMDGQKAPDMAEALKNLPADQRAQVEAAMKQRGISTAGGGSDIKMCLDKDSLDKGRWRNDQGNCKTDFTAQTSSRWAWKSVCTEPMASSSVGETVFSGPDAYTTKMTSQVTQEGKQHTVVMTMNSKWLGADCGDIKPVKPGMAANGK